MADDAEIAKGLEILDGKEGRAVEVDEMKKRFGDESQQLFNEVREGLGKKASGSI